MMEKSWVMMMYQTDKEHEEYRRLYTVSLDDSYWDVWTFPTAL